VHDLAFERLRLNAREMDFQTPRQHPDELEQNCRFTLLSCAIAHARAHQISNHEQPIEGALSQEVSARR
jgi:hypothetical protein